MSIHKMNTKHYICQLERTQLPTIIAMFVQNPDFLGYLLTGNRSSFLYVESFTSPLYDCPQFLSPVYEADNGFDIIAIYYQDTVKYIDLITRNTFNYASPISWDNNPQKVIALDLDTNEHYVLRTKPVLRATPMLFKPKQVQSAVRLNTFTAQEAGINSNTELTSFWNPVLFIFYSDKTLMLLRKAI